jgi:hypothetical protein
MVAVYPGGLRQLVAAPELSQPGVLKSYGVYRPYIMLVLLSALYWVILH